ncbi:MAG: hypothetical protein ACYC5O_17450 [Anaerolineae bacterium]
MKWAEHAGDVGQVLYWALALDPRREGGAAMKPEGMQAAIARLFALFSERRIPYLLVGGIAMLQYVEGRNTRDVDVILALSSLQSLPELQVTGEDLYFATASFEGLPVHVLLTRNPLFARAEQQYATECQLAGLRVRCATVSGLLLLKLYALPSLYRQGDFVRVSLYENDIAALIERYDPPMEPIVAALHDVLSETDLGALGEVLADIRGRLERFRRGIGGSGKAP